MRKCLAVGILLALFTSCEYRFDVESSMKSPILYVESIVGLPGDMDYLKVQKATPVGQQALPSDEYVINAFEVRQDDVLLPVERVRDTVFFYTDVVDVAGSRLALTIKAEGLAGISAVTDVPLKPGVEVECSEVGDNLRWTLRLTDDGLEHYALTIRPLYVYEDGTLARGSAVELSPDYVDGSLDGLFSGAMNVSFTSLEEEYELTLFDRNEAKGGKVTFLSSDVDGKFEVLVFALSDEAYGYLKAKYNRERNVLGILGLSPPNFAYSNISGGYGVFGAVSYFQKTIEL